jgi:hypothetical protein
MKKIISLVALLAGIVFVTSCSSDDASYVPTPKLEIKSAQVLFDAEGGDGSIVLNTTGTVTATTDASWLSLAVQGNTVTVTANPNITLNGRSAVINLVSGDTQAQVTATQKGSVYGLYSDLDLKFDDAARSLSISIDHPSTVQLKPLADWITATFDDATNEITVQITQNNSGWRRSGKLVVETAGLRDTLKITQFDFLNDIQGTYLLVYQSNGQWVYTTVDLSRTNDSNGGQLTFLSGSYAANGFTIPVEFNVATESFSIYNLAEMGGKYTKSGVEYGAMTMVMGLSADNKIYRFNNDKLAIECKLIEEDGAILFDMVPNSELDSKYSLYGLRIGYTTGGYAGYVGAVATFPGCYLLKM